MKNQKLCILSLSIIFLGFFSKSAQAQDIDTRVGAMIAYGTKAENIGIGANAEFGIADKISISPSFIFYIPKTEGAIKVNWFELNANGNYYFLKEGNFDVYGLAGLNYSNVKAKYNDPFFENFAGSSASDGRFGLNLGAGTNMHLSNHSILPFAEIKYVIMDGGQLVIAAGVKFKI